MVRIIVVAFTLLCFTGCATFQPVNARPAALEQPAQPAGGGDLEQGQTPEEGSEAGYGGWIVLGIAALLIAVLIASDDGGGGGY